MAVRVNKESQVEISVPFKSSQNSIEEFISHNRDWIFKQLDLRHQQSKLIIDENIGFEFDQYQYFLGHKLQIQPQAPHSTNLSIGLNHIYIDSAWSLARRESEWESFTREKASQNLMNRTIELANEHGFKNLSGVKVRKMKSTWGNCRSNGLITLSLKLMKLPKHLIDAIILHELCHLIHQNHSSKFYQLLASLDKSWKKHRLELREWSAKF